MNKIKISFFTQGCRLNQSETASLKNGFEEAGFKVVDFDGDTNLVVINTCTVTEKSDRDTRLLINKFIKKNPKVKIVLIGCQAQVWKEKLLALPNVVLVVGNEEKMDLVGKIKNIRPHPLLRQGFGGQALTPSPQVERGDFIHVTEIKKRSFTIPYASVEKTRTRANLKIQDGCDNYCAYCIVPYARGPVRSREFEDVLRGALELVVSGVKEIVLTGVNIGNYGTHPLNPPLFIQKEGDLNYKLEDVLRELSAIEGMGRKRISSIELTTLSEKLLDLIAGNEKLCRYLHIPLQSGNDSVLKRMGRKYSVQEYADFVRLAVEKVDGICIGTDVIVGFPGETEAAFQETYEFLENSPLAYFHVFSYSDRAGTKSFEMQPKVANNVIQKRSKFLRDLSEKKRQEFRVRQVNKTVTVLFEQEKNGFWTGLTDNYIRMQLKSEQNLENKMVAMKLEDVCCI